jgi:hypothetical protein
MLFKETLTGREISELADILNDNATISMTFSSGAFVPFVRVQAYTDLDSLKDKFGGSTYTFPVRNAGQTPKSSWSWNRSMMRAYLPQLLPHLNETPATKAKLILQALALSKSQGKGKPVTTEVKRKLAEIFLEIKKLQQPRGQYDKLPWDIDDSPFKDLI